MSMSAEQIRYETKLMAEWMEERGLGIADGFALLTLMLKLHLDSIKAEDYEKAKVIKAVRRVLGDLPN